jgi:glutamine amidotransferase
MTVIIDYGLGNIQAFANVYKRLNVPVSVARTATDLANAERLILPGVGSFDHAMKLLNASGMREAIDALVLEQKVPILGVCVGMQIMTDQSEEGDKEGLSWVPGNVRLLRPMDGKNSILLPHMGWNDVTMTQPNTLFEGLKENAKFYFLHSYGVFCDSPDNSVASVDYGTRFTCAIRKDNIFGVQFHPEKSHHYGVTLLKNFAAL